QNEIERTVTIHQGKRLTSAFGYSNRVLAGTQEAPEGVTDIFFIVNDEQFCHLDAPGVRQLDYEGAALSGRIQKDAAPVRFDDFLGDRQAQSRMTAFKSIRSPLLFENQVAHFERNSW